ncbi:hypothetical protein Strvi_2986 [Streptomyces violaceusniger Tu 4113]|uniref:DUF4145 domain-containing protein n=1 Tax=Streptomyces violaceusniger (strain Tu 4113) TaxID=653045 RepID=G2PDT3_STRV4|nr:hypothetical protein Strvi_2986 [Streptomyces violaceusniger Tu 4113]
MPALLVERRMGGAGVPGPADGAATVLRLNRDRLVGGQLAAVAELSTLGQESVFGVDDLGQRLPQLPGVGEVVVGCERDAPMGALRVQLRAAFTRMTRVETPAGAIEFAAEARDVLNQAEDVATADQPLRSPFPEPEEQTPRREPTSSDAGYEYQAPINEPAGNEHQVPINEPFDLPKPPPWFRQNAGQSPPPTATEAPPPPPPTPAPEPPLAEPPSSVRLDTDYAPPVFPPLLPDPRQAPALEAPSAAGGQAPTWLAEFRDARDMVDASAVGAVVTAWNVLSTLCLDALRARAILLPANPSPLDLGKALRLLGLPPSATTVFDRLRKLRNQAVHSANTVTPGAARDFVDSCLTVARELDPLNTF